MAGIFGNIGSYPVIDPYGTVVFVYVCSQVFAGCRTHILNQEGSFSSLENPGSTDPKENITAVRTWDSSFKKGL